MQPEWTAPGNLEALTCRIRLCYQRVLLNVVAFLEFFRRNIAAGGVESLAVVPCDPFHRSEGDILDAAPRTAEFDELFLVKTIHRLRSCIIIGITFVSHGAYSSDITQPLRIPDRGVLREFKGSSQHRLVDRSIGTRRALLRGSSS